MKHLLLFITTCLLFSSCASLQKGSSSFDDSDSPYVADDTSATPKVKPKEKKTDDIVVKEEKVKVIDEDNMELFNYYVIIGSFRVLDNAKNYKQELFAEGFNPVLLENENGLYRVSVAAFNKETPARNKATSIRDQYSNHDDTWLLIRKQ